MSLTDLKYCREANAKLKDQLAAVTKERDEHKIGFDVMFRYLELDVIPEAARAVAEAIDKHRAAALQGDGT